MLGCPSLLLRQSRSGSQDSGSRIAALDLLHFGEGSAFKTKQILQKPMKWYLMAGLKCSAWSPRNLFGGQAWLDKGRHGPSPLATSPQPHTMPRLEPCGA